MVFNVSKCVHLPTTNKIKPSSHKYSLFGEPLSTVFSHPYLGVKLDTKLAWINYVTEITSKSSKVLGMIKTTLGPCKPEVKDTAYSMLVRPKLEYSSPIWIPHTMSQVKCLKKTTLGPCKPEVKDTAYSMLVQPKLEYSSPIWIPHTMSQVKCLKKQLLARVNPKLKIQPTAC